MFFGFLGGFFRCFFGVWWPMIVVVFVYVSISVILLDCGGLPSVVAIVSR